MGSHNVCDDAHLVLTGPMGSGKTTVGRILASRLNRPFHDSDIQIEARYGVPARELAAERGVAWLHEQEAESLRRALAENSPVVVAAAASVGDLPDLGGQLAGGVVTVLLEGDPDILAHRARTGRHRRPVSPDSYREAIRRRHRALVAHVDLTVNVTRLGPEEVASAVLDYCRIGSATRADDDAQGGE